MLNTLGLPLPFSCSPLRSLLDKEPGAAMRPSRTRRSLRAFMNIGFVLLFQLASELRALS